MTAWLVDTLLYTGGLIALVLMIRRPVARHFGAQVAYALWALPFLRFIMPPLVLPAWMAPASAPAAAPMLRATSAALTEKTAGIGGETIVPALAADGSGGWLLDGGLADLALAVWLGGALLFLLWRARSYFAMRAALLEDACPVGEVGNIRLIESPHVLSPLAFGVRDKVVALPPCFMAHPDRAARDLAIAHELAHHRGRDLLANILAQPLLALHWFNPLAWAGWRAMRRDQEAACDARVVAGRARDERALYASVIAGFAVKGNRMALAAPMACRMLGERSIISRLRNLASAEVPAIRRRAGLGVIGVAALAMPLTASISYAAPPLPSEPPVPPLPRVAAASMPQAPDAPAVPLPPEPVESADPDGDGAFTMPAPPPTPAAPLPPNPPAPPPVQGRPVASADMARAVAMEQAAWARAQAAAVRAQVLEAAARAREAAMMRTALHVTSSNSCGGSAPVIERQFVNGDRAIVLCGDVIGDQTMAGLREARRAIAGQRELAPHLREQLLRRLDSQIGRLSDGGVIAVSLRLELRPQWPDSVNFPGIAPAPALTPEQEAAGLADRLV